MAEDIWACDEALYLAGINPYVLIPDFTILKAQMPMLLTQPTHKSGNVWITIQTDHEQTQADKVVATMLKHVGYV